jgi:redox-sensing transcriptional repressor
MYVVFFTIGGSMEKGISPAVIRRMPRYYRYLGELLEDGVERISSNDLSRRMHVTASQIRQDLNNFGGFGQQGHGYNVQFLYDEIGKILGQTHMNHVILVGVGNLGQAIANYVKFEKLSFKMIGLFDIDPSKKGKEVSGIKIQMVDELEEFMKTHQVDIVALTIPKESAEPIARRLIELGVKAFWNFAHVDLDVPEGVIVENVHLSDSLMTLSYNITKLK